MVKKVYSAKFQIPEEVQVDIEGNTIKVKGSKGELQRTFMNPRLDINKEGSTITIKCREGIKFSRSDKMFINTYRAHMRNVFRGARYGFTAKLKVCSGHFPITVSVSGNTVSIKNFLGKKVPRTTTVMDGAKVEVKGDEIFVSGLDKEVVGQTAARIEQATRITNRDRRIFQDGCYITKKPGDQDE